VARWANEQLFGPATENDRWRSDAYQQIERQAGDQLCGLYGPLSVTNFEHDPHSQWTTTRLWMGFKTDR